LINNVELQKEIGQQGYNFVKENYTWEETGSILENLIISTAK